MLPIRVGGLTATIVMALCATAFVGTGYGQTPTSIPVSISLDEPARTAAMPAVTQQLLPDLHSPALVWFGAAVALLLMLSFRPARTMRNLDGIVLALTCLLLTLRGNDNLIAGQTGQWWSYLLLSISAAYWLLRGVLLLLAKRLPGVGCNVSESAMTVLLLAGLAVAVGRIASDPITTGARDAIAGGICTADTGKLPYGDAPGLDAHSPLLYLLDAGVVKVLRPSLSADDQLAPLTWGTRGAWLDTAWAEQTDVPAARVANGLLLVLMLGALYVIGLRLHSVPLGLTLVAILCVFPGTTECLSRPEIMLPAALLAWSVAFALLPGVGGLLSLLVAVFAGLAWPWAWLLVPVLLAYFLRRGWHALGAVGGLLGGTAACLALLTWLTAPALPRGDGALAAAGVQPAYAASLSEDGAVVIAEHQPAAEPLTDFKTAGWKWLVERERVTLNAGITPGESPIIFPNGIDGGDVPYRAIAAEAAARPLLQNGYRAAMAQAPVGTRLAVALRSVIESTWLTPAAPERPIKSTWELWAGTDPVTGQPSGRWTMIRRGAKLLAGLISIAAAVLLLLGGRPRPHQLVGGLLAVGSVSLFASELGMATNLVWLLPLALAAPATLCGEAEETEAPAVRPPARPPADPGPAPRITVER